MNEFADNALTAIGAALRCHPNGLSGSEIQRALPTPVPHRTLHEGNCARYRIRPSEFAAWRQAWDARQ